MRLLRLGMLPDCVCQGSGRDGGRDADKEDSRQSNADTHQFPGDRLWCDTDVVNELTATEAAIEGEAVALSGVHHNLRRFSPEETRHIRSLLADYTRAVIKDDWPELAKGRLSERVDRLLWQLENALLDLKTTSATQETLRSRAIADLEMISDYRQTRLKQARERPPQVLIVVFLGYLVTMVYFAVYPPRRSVLVLISLYTMFVGVVIYLILAMSDPFQGATPIDSGPLQYVLDTTLGTKFE